MNVEQLEQLAFNAARLSIESRREIPLARLGEGFKTTDKVVFTDQWGNPSTCMSLKFVTIEDFKNFCNKKRSINTQVYVYTAYEHDVFDMKLEKTGVEYIIRLAVKAN